ncbi:MAG: DUF3240 family protein [Bacteroidota bacterium]
MPKTIPLKLVTVVAEYLLRDKLVKEIGKLGVTGFTVTDAEGQGPRGNRAGVYEGRNVRMECVCSPEAATRVLKHLSDYYFEHYAVIAWVQTVEVVRGDKYV